MTVDPTTALSAERDGETFYFCSQHCLDKFEASPETRGEGPETSDGCRESKESTLGSGSSTSSSTYTCPMHPEIEQEGPGSCPICGMDLEPKTITLENDEGDAELDAMTHRFWIAVALSVPVFLLAMLPMMGHCAMLCATTPRSLQAAGSNPIFMHNLPRNCSGSGSPFQT